MLFVVYQGTVLGIINEEFQNNVTLHTRKAAVGTWLIKEWEHFSQEASRPDSSAKLMRCLAA